MQGPSGKKDPEQQEQTKTSTWSDILWGSHSYEVYTPICTKGGSCTLDTVFGILRSERRFVTPTAQTEPVEDGSKTSIPMLGTVEHSVDVQHHKVTNTTQADHLLNPGVVEREIVERGGEIGVHTTGTGDGFLPRQNESLAPYVWGFPDSALKETYKEKYKEKD